MKVLSIAVAPAKYWKAPSALPTIEWWITVRMVIAGSRPESGRGRQWPPWGDASKSTRIRAAAAAGGVGQPPLAGGAVGLEVALGQVLLDLEGRRRRTPAGAPDPRPPPGPARPSAHYIDPSAGCGYGRRENPEFCGEPQHRVPRASSGSWSDPSGRSG